MWVLVNGSVAEFRWVPLWATAVACVLITDSICAHADRERRSRTDAFVTVSHGIDPWKLAVFLTYLKYWGFIDVSTSNSIDLCAPHPPEMEHKVTYFALNNG